MSKELVDASQFVHSLVAVVCCPVASAGLYPSTNPISKNKKPHIRFVKMPHVE